GLPQAGVPESLGGAGASFAEALVVAEAAGWHALPLPLVETILANWLLAQVGRPPVPGAAGVASISGELLILSGSAAGWRLSGSLPRVPWGRKVEHLVFIARTTDGGTAIVCMPAETTNTIAGRSVANE